MHLDCESYTAIYTAVLYNCVHYDAFFYTVANY